MKNIKQFVLIIAINLILASGMALADQHGGGSGGGGYRGSGGGYRGSGGSYGVYIGIPFGGYNPYYSYSYPYTYPYYPDPSYANPPVVGAPQIPPPAPQQENYWYHCDNPDGYYPYISECPGGWKQVSPHPPALPASEISKLNAGQRDENSLDYDNETKIGLIKYKAFMEERNKVFEKIEEVCSTKNVELQSGGTHSKYGATYTTLDEKYINNVFEIKFKCIY